MSLLRSKSQQQEVAICAIYAIISAIAYCVFQIADLFSGSTQNDFHITLEATIEHAGYLVFVSTLSAIVEELVFRGLLLQALLRVLTKRKAAWISALVFGLLHAIPLGINPETMAANSTQVTFALLLKFTQATLFGIIMAYLITAGNSLAAVIGIHTLFNVIYFAPEVLAYGEFPSTYALLTPMGLSGLIASVCILAAPLIVRRFSH